MRIKSMNRFLCMTLLVSAAAAQTFEVASIRPNSSGDTHSDYSVSGEDGAKLATKNVNLITLIQRAFQVHQYQIAGPDWLTDARFDINATMPAGTERNQLPGALQAMLKERFGLALHRETKEQPVYALSIGGSGPKMQSTPDPQATSGTWQSRGQYKAVNENMAHFCDVLSRQLGKPVLDATGLSGAYDFVLDYDPQDGMSLFVAIEQKLGLRLESKKAPVELLVIDRVEKSPTEN
jgi:uncharacterized protein (TIGR03435 family)